MPLSPQSENSFIELLFNNALSPIVYLDRDFNILQISRAYALLLDKLPDELIGTNFFDLIPQPECRDIFQSALDTGKPYIATAKKFNCFSKAALSNTLWDWTLTGVKNSQDDVTGLLLQMVDVTDKVKIEQMLHEKIKQDVMQYDNELEKIIESRTHLLQDAVEQLQYENKERIKTEKLLLKAKEEAEKANVSKSQFLSRMSHELRTPLNAILGFSQLLKSNGLNEELNEFNNEVLMAGKHLLSMISDILDLSRIETGNVSVSVSDVHLLSVVNESIALVKHKLNFRNIEIHNLIDDEDKVFLKADETRLKEVIVNLLTNAIKYNSDNGLVSIGYKIQDKDHVQIYVSDTGKGLSEKEQKLIFEPFNRIGAEYTDIEGVGIGLTISQKLMEQMGGDILIESEKDKGSTFFVSCPVGEEFKLDESEFEQSFDFDLTGETYDILYVEDNNSNLKVMVNLLNDKPNLNLTIAESAEEGMDKIYNKLFDLIILDINLPGMDGYEALQQLKERAETKDIPVIALSASASQKDIEKGLAAGFSKYITKPVMLPELLSIIQTELHSQAKH